MFNKSNIYKFFMNECDANDKDMEYLYSLDLHERIKKRKAINHIKIDLNSKKSENNYIVVNVIIKINLSDFKIGDYLVIHDNNPYFPISSCILYDFLEDGNFSLGFKNNDFYKIKNILNSNPDKEFILDKNKSNILREIYKVGYLDIKDQDISLVNNIPKPTFTNNKDEIYNEISDTEKNFKINLSVAQREAIANSMMAKDYYLIQGPPGTGKTFVISILLIELLLYSKEKVLVSGPNHLAINNIIKKLLNICPSLSNAVVKVGPFYNNFNLDFIDYNGEKNYAISFENINTDNCNNWDYTKDNKGLCIGLTPFKMHSSQNRGLKFDTLIIDESGQMNIGLALMAMSCAKKVIFVGDHKQMPPIFSYEKHDVCFTKSIFEHLYKDYNCTTLDISYRMNDCICNTISSLFYNDILKSAFPHKRLTTNFPITQEELSPKYPIICKNIIHNGTNFSEEEASEIIEIIKTYICKYNVSPNDIGIIAPFRAQCALIRKKIINLKNDIKDYKSIIVETVDRMQGQEKDIIIISITTGNLEYMSELTNFIFNKNRFNVAISRAKTKLIILGNINNIKKYASSINCIWFSDLLASENIKIL